MSQNKGFIKLYRDVKDHWIWQEDSPFNRRDAWIDMLMRANHKEQKVLINNEVVPIQRGQFLCSERNLASDYLWSRTKLRNFLELLESDTMIELNKDHGKTIVTICNYSDWQGSQNQERTTEEPQKDHRRTTERPKQEVKNDKNEEESSSDASEENSNNFFEGKHITVTGLDHENHLLAYPAFRKFPPEEQLVAYRQADLYIDGELEQKPNKNPKTMLGRYLKNFSAKDLQKDPSELEQTNKPNPDKYWEPLKDWRGRAVTKAQCKNPQCPRPDVGQRTIYYRGHPEVSPEVVAYCSQCDGIEQLSISRIVEQFLTPPDNEIVSTPTRVIQRALQPPKEETADV